MKHIIKSKEPVDFINWKNQEHEKEVISRHIKNKNHEALWDFFKSNLPDAKEEGLYYYSKAELLKVLLEEQGYLCCYCNRQFTDEDVENSVKESEIAHRPANIEHLTLKSEDVTKTLEYSNLSVSCNGKYSNKSPSPDSCNLFRSDKPIYVFPTNKDCEQRIYFDFDGKIRGKDKEADITIKNLGLEYHNEDRGGSISGFIYEDKENQIFINIMLLCLLR